MRRRIVLLPLPDAPSRTKSSPGATSRVTRSTVTSPANRFVTPSSAIDTALAPLPLRVAQQEEEDEERQGRQHRRDRVGGRDVARLELREDVEGRRLRLQPQVSRDEDRGAELAERVREGQQGAREEAAPQRRQDD